MAISQVVVRAQHTVLMRMTHASPPGGEDRDFVRENRRTLPWRRQDGAP